MLSIQVFWNPKSVRIGSEGSQINFDYVDVDLAGFVVMELLSQLFYFCWSVKGYL